MRQLHAEYKGTSGYSTAVSGPLYSAHIPRAFLSAKEKIKKVKIL
jgi:hypothetical protein